VDPRAGLDDVEKKKFLTVSELELRPLGRPGRSYRYTDYAILAHTFNFISGIFDRRNVDSNREQKSWTMFNYKATEI
jgi:hypothetical protein